MSHDDSIQPLGEDELAAQEAELLPPREEMSVIDPDPGGVPHHFLGGPQPLEPNDVEILPVE